MEVEQAPAVSLTLASMDRTAVSLFTVTGETIPDAGAHLQSSVSVVTAAGNCHIYSGRVMVANTDINLVE